MPFMRSLYVALLFVLAGPGAIAETALAVKSPMAPPAWALLERELLRFDSLACERFAAKYVDERGYLLHTMRWGTLDGPDDAIETFFNWTLLHALGGSDTVLEAYKKAQEGHWKQYGEMRTRLTKLAENGAYHKEFVTQSDWFHTGEGMRAFMLLGLSQPTNARYIERMKRFAGLYMNEDPEAPNYDPERKLIKSIWNGSKGPMLHKATVYDWVGDPVPGKFHLLHNPAGRGKMLDLEAWYPKMLAHCADYVDSTGDNPLNLAAATLALNAYALTGETKYRDWITDYVGAWKRRADACGGNIPSNVGLDGTPGGEYKGQWWKGTYGWNFTIFDGEIEKIAHRNNFEAGAWPGFSAALLATGDQSYVDVLRRQMDNLYAHKKKVRGKVLLPRMYGDPRGYKFDGPPQWYYFIENPYAARLIELYLWSMDQKDLKRVEKTGWIGYLEGLDAGYPEKALAADLERVRKTLADIREDTTTPETRLADYLLGMNPAETDALTNLMLGGYFGGRIWTLHSRFRYFDPVRRRAGLPEDVAALVEKLGADSATLTLVNVSPLDARTVTVQAGGYGEHRFDTARIGGEAVAIGAPLVEVHLEPGCGTRIEFKMTRYQNRPTLAQPWGRTRN